MKRWIGNGTAARFVQAKVGQNTNLEIVRVNFQVVLGCEGHRRSVAYTSPNKIKGASKGNSPRRVEMKHQQNQATLCKPT